MEARLHPLILKPQLILPTIKKEKTVTRRLSGLEKINETPDDYALIDEWVENGVFYAGFRKRGTTEKMISIKCRYGVPGDNLWVKENWNINDNKVVIYAADYIDRCVGWSYMKWKPSIHMSKRACRLMLKVKNIRVERLQDITEEDAMCEGVTPKKPLNISHWKGEYHFGFYTIWISINGKYDTDGIESWNKNPWVWVIRFEINENFLYFDKYGCPIFKERSKN